MDSSSKTDAVCISQEQSFQITCLRALVMESPASPATSFPLLAARTDKRVAIRTTKLPSISRRTESQRSTVCAHTQKKGTQTKAKRVGEGDRRRMTRLRQPKGGGGGAFTHSARAVFDEVFFEWRSFSRRLLARFQVGVTARKKKASPRALV